MDALTTGSLCDEVVWSVRVFSAPHAAVAVKHSPVTVILNAIAAPLAPLPVARVFAVLGGLWGALEDPKSMSQALLEVALVHLVSAVPGEGHQRLARPPGAWPTSPPCHQAEGHLLTDAVATHAALLPVALVTVKLVLRGLRHQADAKAARAEKEVGTGTTTPTPDTRSHPSMPARSVPASRRQRASHKWPVPLYIPRAPLRTHPHHLAPGHAGRAFWLPPLPSTARPSSGPPRHSPPRPGPPRGLRSPSVQ